MKEIIELEDFINNKLCYQDPSAQEVVEEILKKINEIKNKN